ncbi:MAG: 2-hydroxychromene-2-carboxylate isomerase [Cypionkella sp.]
MVQVDYFFATISPYCFLAGDRLEAIAARHGATVRYIPIDSAALFARTGGKVLAERHESRKEYRLQELRRWSQRLGMKLDLQPSYFPANPAPSAYAVLSAITAGGGDLPGLVRAFPRAVWAEGRNIAEDEVVKEILAENGFDPAISDHHMMTAADSYVRNLDEAVLRGVFGVPFYMVGEERFWGQDRLEDLDLHLAGKL